MKIIVVKPDEQPRIEEIEHTLEAMQAVVEGYIEAVYLPEPDPVALICNDEGKLAGLPLNRYLWDEDGHIVDFIAGSFFICGAPANSENFESIPDELIDKYVELFAD